VQDYRNLEVWKYSHHLVLEVYRATKAYPKDEVYGLTSQTRRAASSIPANIAEGCGRNSDGDFRRFLQIALGSAMELDYHLLLARDLGYIDEQIQAGLADRIDRVRRMLGAFIKRLN
jgi:four helix bundle protein